MLTHRLINHPHSPSQYLFSKRNAHSDLYTFPPTQEEKKRKEQRERSQSGAYQKKTRDFLMRKIGMEGESWNIFGAKIIDWEIVFWYFGCIWLFFYFFLELIVFFAIFLIDRT